MRTAFGGLLAGFAAGATVVFLGVGSLPGQAQPAASGAIPRTASGKPDLNGLWQALNTANYDIQAHTALPAMAMRPGPVVPLPAKEVIALGAVGSVPAGNGVVVGDELPYCPKRWPRRRRTRRDGSRSIPKSSATCRRAARHLHALPVPDFPERERLLHRLRVRERRAQHLPEGSGAAADRLVDGTVVGRWESDTFVVESSGFNDQTWFDRAGNFHSEQMTVVERYR